MSVDNQGPGRPPDTPWLAPYLTVADPERAMGWYRQVFAFEQGFVRRGRTGEIEHGELVVHDQKVMVAPAGSPGGADASPAMSGVTSPVTLFLYVPDTDAVCQRAKAAGAKVLLEPATMFWGDRICKIADPDGHLWVVATHVKDVSEEDIHQGGLA
ncbi:VOC family protein [Dactylosporangium sp. CA-092794]|uniref:VOC family protein n=1 Tax=Dactylosporangium sp. CA-092794 TaxID=3239929 RepID=UPI003D919F0E